MEETAKPFILVAEDDKFYANVYKSKLAKEGFDVVVAKDGEEALITARKRRPDLMLLDLIMPGKDGFETLKELRADPNLADTTVIVISNLGQEEDRKKVRELGAAGYIVKADVSLQEMIEQVKSHL